MSLNEFVLEFTPLEFETFGRKQRAKQRTRLEFTPLEYETKVAYMVNLTRLIRIYSVGV